MSNRKTYYDFTTATTTYRLAFCNDLPTDQWCSADKKTMGIATTTSTCTTLTGSNPTDDAEFEVDDQDNNDGLRINYKGGDKCTETENYSLTVHIQCDSSIEGVETYTVDETNPCAKSITFKNKVGCKNGQLSALWDWFSSNKWVMFAVFLIVGTVVCFLGRTLFKPVLFFAGLLLSISLVWLIFYSTFLSSNTESWVGWVVLIGAILLGLLIGSCFVKIAKLGAFILAGWGGFSVSLLIYNALLYKMDSQVGFWCFTLGVALFFGVLALFFFDHILIHATAILGSFMAVYGIGLVAGHYQNPFTIAELMKHNEIDSIDPVFYGYLAGNLVLYIAGAAFQYKQRKSDQKNGHDPYNRLR